MPACGALFAFLSFRALTLLLQATIFKKERKISDLF